MSGQTRSIIGSWQDFEALLLKAACEAPGVRPREDDRAPDGDAEPAGGARRTRPTRSSALGEELEVAMLDRESREAAQIDAALERLLG